MNREIKFRAWDKKNNKMYYNVGVGALLFTNYEWDNDFECFTVEETYDEKDLEVMQFTGLKDINGKEIYEGDILNVSKEYSGNFQPIIIVFEDGCFKGQVYHKMNKPFILDVPISTLEIIGNIFENPELIKECI